MPKRIASEPRMVFGLQQRRSLLTEALPPASSRQRCGSTAAHPDPSRSSRTAEHMDQTVEELRRILQSGAQLGSPQHSFLGISPPARCNDGLVQDAMWQRNFHKGSRSNLQVIRELDQKGVPFLRGSRSSGDTRLILGSPDFEFLASYGAADSRASSTTCAAAAGRTPSPAPCDIDVLGY